MNKTEDKIKAELKAISFMPDANEIREYYLEDFNLINALEKNRQRLLKVQEEENNFTQFSDIGDISKVINLKYLPYLDNSREYKLNLRLTDKQLAFIIDYLNDINNSIDELNEND